MSLALNEAQFSSFLQYLKHESQSALQIQKAVTSIGLQKKHELWVMGEGIQIDSDGVIVPAECQSHIWLNWSVEQGLGAISLRDVLPTIMLPLTSEVIEKAITMLSQLMKHNLIPSILMMAGRVKLSFFVQIIYCGTCRIDFIHVLFFTDWLPNCCG